MLKRIDSFHGSTSTTVWDAEKKGFASQHFSLSFIAKKREVVTARAPSASSKKQLKKLHKNVVVQQIVTKPSPKGQSPRVLQPDSGTLKV